METVLAMTQYVLLFILLLYLAGKGIVCGNCDAAMSRFRSPFFKTRRQWWEGGTTCAECGCDCDRYGNKV